MLLLLDLWAHFDAWDHKYESGKHIFTIKHDVNQGFSVFSKECIYALLKAPAGTKVTFEAMSPNSVTFTFEDTLRNLNSNPRHTNNTVKSTSTEIPIRSSA